MCASPANVFRSLDAFELIFFWYIRNLCLYGTNETSVPTGTERVLHSAGFGEILCCRGVRDLCHMPVVVTVNICYRKVN